MVSVWYMYMSPPSSLTHPWISGAQHWRSHRYFSHPVIEELLSGKTERPVRLPNRRRKGMDFLMRVVNMDDGRGTLGQVHRWSGHVIWGCGLR